MELRQITIDEIVRGIRDDRRDFSKTKLIGDSSGYIVFSRSRNLSSHARYEEMQTYLTGLPEDELRNNPIQINDSDWKGLIANELYLPFLRAIRTDLREAQLYKAELNEAILSRADLYKAELNEAILSRANLSEADLREANMEGANLSQVNMGMADLYKAKLGGADLWDADLSGARNLEYAICICNAFYLNTHISPEQEEIIIAAFEKAGKKVGLGWLDVVK